LSSRNAIRSVIIIAMLAVRVAQWLATQRQNDDDDDTIITEERSFHHDMGGDDAHSSIPPYPGVLPPCPGGIIPPTDSRICPICRSSIRNACVSTGGYIFCYACLRKHLHQSAACPVTGLYCSENDIIRLFEDDE